MRALSTHSNPVIPSSDNNFLLCLPVVHAQKHRIINKFTLEGPPLGREREWGEGVSEVIERGRKREKEVCEAVLNFCEEPSMLFIIMSGEEVMHLCSGPEQKSFRFQNLE